MGWCSSRSGTANPLHQQQPRRFGNSLGTPSGGWRRQRQVVRNGRRITDVWHTLRSKTRMVVIAARRAMHPAPLGRPYRHRLAQWPDPMGRSARDHQQQGPRPAAIRFKLWHTEPWRPSCERWWGPVHRSDNRRLFARFKHEQRPGIMARQASGREPDYANDLCMARAAVCRDRSGPAHVVSDTAIRPHRGLRFAFDWPSQSAEIIYSGIAAPNCRWCSMFPSAPLAQV